MSSSFPPLSMAEIQPTANSQIGITCHARPSNSWTDGNALSQDKLVSSTLYPPFHPAVKRLNQMMQDLSPEVSVRVHIERTDEENAFALPSGDVVVSDSILKKLSGTGATEMVYALLQHELTHIESGDSLSRLLTPSLRRTRFQEFRADISEASELSKHGINPMGAILLQHAIESSPTLGGETSVRRKHWQLPIEVSPEHGSASERITTLEELARFRDLPLLSRNVGYENFEDLLTCESRHADSQSVLDLPPKEFWPACTAIAKRSDQRDTIYARLRDYDIPEEDIKSLSLILFPIRHKESTSKAEPISLSTLSLLLQEGVFEEIGRMPSSEMLISAIKETITAELCKSSDLEPLKKLHEEVEVFVNRTSLNPKRDMVLLDTEIIIALLVERSKVSPFKWEINDEKLIRITEINSSLPDVSVVWQNAEFIGIKNFDFSAVWIGVLDRIGAVSIDDYVYKRRAGKSEHFRRMEESDSTIMMDSETGVNNKEEEWWMEDDSDSESTYDKPLESPESSISHEVDNVFADGSEVLFQRGIKKISATMCSLLELISTNSKPKDLESRLLNMEKLLSSFVSGASTNTFFPNTINKNSTITDPYDIGQFEHCLSIAASNLYTQIKNAYSLLYNDCLSLESIKSCTATIRDESRSNPERISRLLHVGKILTAIQNICMFSDESLNDFSNNMDKRYDFFQFTAVVEALSTADPRQLRQYLTELLEKDLGRIAEDKTYNDEDFLHGDPKYIKDLLNAQISLVDAANSIFEKDFGIPGIRLSDKAQIWPISVIAKRCTLTSLASSNGVKELLNEAKNAISKWPIVWTPIDSEEYISKWGPVAYIIQKYLISDPSLPKTLDQAEQVLCLTLLEQGSFGSGIVASRLLCKIVQLSSSTLEATEFLERYEFLPPSVLKEPVELLLSERARSPIEIRRIGALVQRRFNEDDFGEILLGSHIAGIVTQLGLKEEERASLFLGLVTKNNTDEALRKLMAPIWWSSQAKTITEDSIRDVAGLAILAERSIPKDYTDKSLNDAAQLAQRIPHERLSATYVPFDDTMRQLHQAGPVFNYLLLQQLAVRGRGEIGQRVREKIIEEYPTSHRKIFSHTTKVEPLFNSAETRAEIFNGICNHYVKGGTKSALETPAIRAAVHALTHGPTSEKLFHFVGPLLAHLASQVPKVAGKFDKLPPSVGELVNKYLEKAFPDLNHPFPGQDFTLTRQLSEARALGLLAGTPPTLNWNSETKSMSISIESGPEIATINRTIADRIPGSQSAQTLPTNLSVVDLALMVGEHHHSTGRRMLQLYALIRGNEMTEEDRTKIYRSFDRSPGMNKFQVMDIVDREAKNSPRLQALVDTIKEIPPIEHGGSIFTVPRVILSDGTHIALHVENTNAAYFAVEVADFYRSLIDNLPEDIVTNRDKALIYALLDSATEWTLAEVNDPNYIDNFIEFRKRNDWREVTRNGEGYRAGIERCRFIVPDIADTGTLKVRWQEWWAGTTLAEMEVGAKTNTNKKTISKNDLREVSARIVQNFFHQLLEDGLFHSNVHPGNFAVRNSHDNVLEVAIFDTKNIIRIDSEDQRKIVNALKLYQQGDVNKAGEALIGLVLPENKIKSSDLVAGLQIKFKEQPPKGLEDGFSTVLTYLSDRGVRVPLKWMLLAQNLIGCKNILDSAGIDGGIGEAFLWTSDGEEKRSPIELISEIYPKSFAVIKRDLGLGGFLGSLFLMVNKKRR